jgi:seryl-tRNA synthetase
LIDIRLIRSDPNLVQEKLRRRDPNIDISYLVELDKRYREILIEVEELRSKRNAYSTEIGALKKEGKDASALISEMQVVSRRIKELEGEMRKLKEEIEGMMLALPNLPHDSVPVSQNKEDKVIVREWGGKPSFDFEPKNHLEIGKRLGIIDMERGAKIAGSQFPLYIGPGALMEWALLCLMIDIQVKKNGYTMVFPPILANTKSFIVAGNLPKFEDQLYKCRDDDLYAIPTAETPLTNLHRDEILEESMLPLKYAAYTPCFRREAGSYGAEERGLIRVHQFNKVELYKITTPETSYDELEGIVKDAEDVVRALGLHYRVSLLVSGDLAQQSAKTYDIEVWLPGQGMYYEVSSCSNCEDYQARRGNIRYRPKKGSGTRFVHTLNGSGLATPRLMVAILETYQQPDGSVIIPEALRPYMGMMERIGP